MGGGMGGRMGDGSMGGGRFGGGMGMGGMDMRPDDPEMAKLDQADMEAENATREFVERYRRAASKEERDEIRERLGVEVTTHFQVRQKRRELELKRLEKQLDHLRGVIEKRTAGKDAIIKGRMTQLLGEQDDLSF